MLRSKLLILGTALYSMTIVNASGQTCNGPVKVRWPIKTSLAQGTTASSSCGPLLRG